MLVDPQHPFFRRLWVRVVCALLPLIWAGVEVATGNLFWAIIFGAAGVYLVVALFFIRKEDP